MVTRPPRNCRSFAYFVSKRISSSSFSARAGMTNSRSSSASSARVTLLVRDIGLLPQHVAERLLILGVHGQQLFAEVSVLSVAFDVGAAFGDGVVEQHQFFFVRDHERGLGFLELRA